MGDQNRNAKRSRAKKYQRLGEEEAERKRQRNNELERERHHEKQFLFNRLDEVLPEEFKTSLHKPGSQSSILENAINFVIAKTEHEVGNSSNQAPPSVINCVSSVSCVSSDNNEGIIQQPNQKMVQQPQLNVTGVQLPMQCQPPLLLMDQTDVQQVPQPNPARAAINHFLQPMPKPAINSFPVTTVTADAQTQQMQIMPLSPARLSSGHQRDTIAIDSQSVPTQLIFVPKNITNQNNYSMPSTSCPKQKYLQKKSQEHKVNQRDLRPKNSSSFDQGFISPVLVSTVSPIETTNMMNSQQELYANHTATTSVLRQSSHHTVPNCHTSMSSQQQININTPATTSRPHQSSYQVMPNFHTTMTSQQQLNSNTPAITSFTHQSSHQVMSNFDSKQTCDFPSPLCLPVPKEQAAEENLSLGILDDLDGFFNSVQIPEKKENGTFAADPILQEIPENSVAQANYDKTTSGQISCLASAGCSGHHTAQKGLEIRHGLPIGIPANEICFRPEQEKENLLQMNIDCTNRPDSPSLLSHPLFMDPY